MDRRHGRFSVGDDDEQLWSGRELQVAVDRAREEGRREGIVEGWNAALVKVGVVGRMRGGVGGLEGGADLRRLVGERFANALEGVWVASLRYLRSPLNDDGGRGDVRVGRAVVKPANRLTDRRLVMPGARSAGGVSLGVGSVVVDEAALAFKGGVDRKIRKLTREMESWLERRSSDREEKVVKRCGKCNRYAEENWKFCPRDGSKLV